MHIDNLQTLRAKLERRVNLVKKSRLGRLSIALQDFFLFFDDEPTLCEIISELLCENPTYKERYLQYKNSPDAGKGETEKELVATGYASLRELSELKAHPRNILGTLYRTHDFNADRVVSQEIEDSRMLEFYFDSFIEPFHIFLDEQLDNRRAIVSILRRYKHRSEWFERDRLRELHRGDTKRGEKNLALDLYRFLFDQGVAFTIEPSSFDGEIDVIASQEAGIPLLADAKVFSGNKNYICKGFGQIYRYAAKYNESSGYLVIFNTTGYDLVFPVSDISTDIPAVKFNHKTIYLLSIDICDHSMPTSKRGIVKSVQITEDDLFTAINEIMEQID